MLLKGIVLTACGFLALSTLADSEYYTWVDENGVTNYAEKKPMYTNARLVTRSQRFGTHAVSRRPAPTDASAAENSPTSQGSGGAVDPDKLIAADREKAIAELAKAKKINCGIGKKNLLRLETYARIKIEDKDGNQRMMTPEEMDAKRAESRALIQDNCTG